jgi:AraC-like DNA-binding protein
MDPLSDLLRIVRLDGAYFFAVEAAAPWSVEALAAAQLTPRVMPASEHLISYHVLTDGRCYGRLLGEEAVELEAGDVIVFPHGDPHMLSSEARVDAPASFQRAAPVEYPYTVFVGAKGQRTASFVCSFLGCDRRPFNPLIEALPRRMVMKGLSSTWRDSFVRLATEESKLGRAGGQSVLTKLAELMFIEVLRRYLEDLPPGQTGWLAGLRDDVVGRALTLLHARPGHPWTLVELATEAASSRSSLAQRFALLVGQPPMQYLAQWRMQVAANRLAQSDVKVAAIGVEVGYESEAAFSRAFKKATGLAPGAWREARHAP